MRVFRSQARPCGFPLASVTHFATGVSALWKNRESVCYTGFIVKQEALARRYLVSGRVQGVGFRNFVEHMARKIGVHGFVRNRRDGSVEVYAIGQLQQLKQLRAALYKGPMMAHVSEVREDPDSVSPQYLGNFTIEVSAD
jgi:acylphosphatase